MLPCGRTDEQTSENRATQSLDSVRLSFAMSNCTHILEIDKILLQIQKNSNYIVNMCFREKLPFAIYPIMLMMALREGLLEIQKMGGAP